MDVRQLRYFVGVAEDLHYGRAAARLHISQPALSRQVQQLERQLGTRLLDRDKRSVKLTHAGAVLLHEARRIIEMTQRAQWVVHSISDRPADVVRIGFTEPLNTYVNSVTLRGLADRHPAIHPLLIPLSSSEQLTALRYRQLDVALVWEIVGAPSPKGAFGRLEVLEDELLLLMSPANPLSRKSVLTRDDLAAEQFLIAQRQANVGMHDVLTATLRSWRVFRDPIITDRESLVGMVTAGLGVTFTARHVASSLRSHLAAKPFAEQPLKVRALYVWREADRGPALMHFLEVARAARDSGKWSFPRPARWAPAPKRSAVIL